MSKLFLSLHKMTPVKSDGKTSVFKHSEGHEVHVKHSSLSPKMKAELDHLVKTKMAKGGAVPTKITPNAKSPKMYAEGDEVSTDPIDLSSALNPNAIQPVESPQLQPRDAGGFQEDTDPTSDLPYSEPYSTQPQSPPPLPTKNLDGTPDYSDKQKTEWQSANPSAAQPPQPKTQPQSAAPQEQLMPPEEPKILPPAPGDAKPQDDYIKQLTAGFGPQIKGFQDVAKAEGQAAKATATAISENNIARQQATANDNANIQNLENERQSVLHDLQNGHIDPDKYIRDMSTAGKISTGIGLILGGLGGGLTGKGGNAALDFLNAQIDRNIHAQQAELGKNENLLSANLKQFGNLQQARDFTRINMNDALIHNIQQAAAKSGDLRAQGEAEKAIGTIQNQQGVLTAKLGSSMTINDPKSTEADVMQAQQRLRLTDPERAKMNDQLIIPGTGVAGSPVPPEDRAKILAGRNYEQALREYADWSSKHSGLAMYKKIPPEQLAKTVAPEQFAELMRGRTMANTAQEMYQKADLGGIYKPGEQPRMDQVINSEAGSLWSKVDTIPQLNELLRSNLNRQANLKNSYHIRPFADTNQTMQTPQQAQSAPVAFKKR